MDRNTAETKIKQSKGWRKRLDEVLQEMKAEQAKNKGPSEHARQLAISITELENTIMRQGMRIKGIEEACPGSAPNPYPESYNPDNAKVEPTADGLKL